MRPSFRSALLAVLLGVGSAPAIAADLSGELGATSDYRYRGLSLSNGKPAVQGSIMLEHASGAYVEVWGSSLGGTGDNVELDFSTGYSSDLGHGLSADIYATFYAYPGSTADNAFEATAAIERETGPLTLNAGLSVAPPQSGTSDDLGRKRANLYLFGGGAYSFARLPVTARAQLGYERGPWDMNDQGGKWDWAIALDVEAGAAKVSLERVGSDAGSDAFAGSLSLRF
jgi:uncharacterized protein (TIGR02001 family)